MKPNHASGTGLSASQRQLRVGELVRRALSEIFSRQELFDPDLEGVSITVGEVKMSPDLRVATAFVSPLGGHNAKKMIEALARNHSEIRHLINKAVDLKYSPSIRFQEDKTYTNMDKVNQLLSAQSVKRDIEE